MPEGIENVDVSEIKVTPEMIEAGVAVLSMYKPAEDDTAEWALEVYLSMRAASALTQTQDSHKD